MPIADASREVMQLVVEGTYAAVGGQSQDIVNVMHYKRQLFTSTWLPGEFLTAWETLVKADWLAAVSLHYTMERLRVRCINDAEEAYTDLAIVGGVGGIAGQCLPSYAAMVLKRTSLLRGRKFQGRSYIAGVPESGSDGNNLAAAQLALFATLATKLNSQVVTAGGLTFVPCIFSASPPSQIQTNPTTVVFTEQSSVTAHSVLGTMGSRKSRVS